MFSKIASMAVMTASVQATWIENASCPYDWETEQSMDPAYLTDASQCISWCQDPARGQFSEAYEVNTDMCCDFWEYTDSESGETWYNCYLNIGGETIDESEYAEEDMAYSAQIFQFTELDEFDEANRMEFDDFEDEIWWDDFMS